MQEKKGRRLVHRHIDLDDAADFEVVGGGGDRALVGFHDLDGHVLGIPEERAGPVLRAERRERRQRHQRHAERQDRPVGGKVVRGRAGGSRNEDSVGDQFVDCVLPSISMRSLAA